MIGVARSGGSHVVPDPAPPCLASHCGPGSDEQPGTQQESHEVRVGQPSAGAGADLENIVLGTTVVHSHWSRSDEALL